MESHTKGVFPEDPDEYTRATRAWLDRRFDLFDEAGVYIPNQSSYGFSAAAFRLEEYARCFAILRLMDRLKFGTFLDVGCADGYMPGLVRLLFQAEVFGVDLSPKAMLRAFQLHLVRGAAAASHCLPFPDNAFDIVLASEVLEHVIDPEAMVAELRRVALKYVIITTPRAPDTKAVEAHFKHLDPGEPHRHLHYFTDADMRRLAGDEAILMGARSRWVGGLFNRLAWDDDRTLAQRKAYLAFTLSSADLAPETRRRVEYELIDRYHDPSGWRKWILSPFNVSWLLRLDAALTAAAPHLARDHLVLIPLGDSPPPSRSRKGTYLLAETMLQCYHVPPLRIDEIEGHNEP